MTKRKPFRPPSQKLYEQVVKRVSRQLNSTVQEFESLADLTEALNDLDLPATVPTPTYVIPGWTDLGISYSVPSNHASMIFVDQYGVNQVSNFLMFRLYEDRPLVPFSYALLLGGEYLAARGHLGLTLFVSRKGKETQRRALKRSGYAVRPIHFGLNPQRITEVSSQIDSVAKMFVVFHEYGHIVFRAKRKIQKKMERFAFNLVTDYGMPYIYGADLRNRGFLINKGDRKDNEQDINERMRIEIAEEIFCDLFALLSVCINYTEESTSKKFRMCLDVMMVLDALDLYRWHLDWWRRDKAKLQSETRSFSIRRQAVSRLLADPEALSTDLFKAMPNMLSAISQLNSELGSSIDYLSTVGGANDFMLSLASSCPSPVERQNKDILGLAYINLISLAGGDIDERFELWDSLFGDHFIESLNARTRYWATLPFTDAIGQAMIRLREWFKFDLADTGLEKLNAKAQRLGREKVIQRLNDMHKDVRNMPQAPFMVTEEGREFLGILLDSEGNAVPENRKLGYMIPQA